MESRKRVVHSMEDGLASSSQDQQDNREYDETDPDIAKKSRGQEPFLIGLIIAISGLIIYLLLHKYVDVSKINGKLAQEIESQIFHAGEMLIVKPVDSMFSHHNQQQQQLQQLQQQDGKNQPQLVRLRPILPPEPPSEIKTDPDSGVHDINNGNNPPITLDSIDKSGVSSPDAVAAQDHSIDSSNLMVAETMEVRQGHLQTEIEGLIKEVRGMRSQGIVMETDPLAKSKIQELQSKLREYLPMVYGPPPYYVEMKLQFPTTMADFAEKGADGIIIIEMAPIDYVPYCVFYFLQLIDHFKAGNFHRNAGHVLQAMVSREAGITGSLAFQEYHASYPHVKYTLGYAGRPGGPAFYISTVDNTHNHGPASQGSKSEADGCFGKVFHGIDVVERMKKQPGAGKPHGFVASSDNFIKIIGFRKLSSNDVKQLV